MRHSMRPNGQGGRRGRNPGQAPGAQSAVARLLDHVLNQDRRPVSSYTGFRGRLESNPICLDRILRL